MRLWLFGDRTLDALLEIGPVAMRQRQFHMKNESSDSSSTQSEHKEPRSTQNNGKNQNLVLGVILGVVVIVLSFWVLQITGDNVSGTQKKSELEKHREEIQMKRQHMGFSNDTPNVNRESPAQLATRLSSESSQLATMVGQLQTSLETLQGDLQMSQTTVRSLSGQLANAVDATVDNDDLHRQLDEALSRASAAEARLKVLQQRSAGAPTEEQLETLLQERDQLRSLVDQLRSKDPSLETPRQP